jgi:hypothetical protein
MTLPLWGSLEKDQDDATTIDEAIAAAIVEHEEDPTAHLGDGESLASHKAEDVIDHPAGSILPDKRSARDLEWNLNFPSVDGYTTIGDVTAEDLKARLYVEDGVVNSSLLSSTLISEQLLSNLEHSILLESSFYFGNGGANTAIVYFSGIEFLIEDDQVRFGVQLTGMSSEVFSSWVALDTTKLHTLRAVFFVLEGLVRCYVDGELVASLSATYTPASEDVSFEVVHNRNTASDDIFFVSKVVLSLYEFQD